SAGHEGKAYPVTGPEALNMAEQARILSEETGRAIQYVALTEDVARENMLKAGMPQTYVDALLKLAAGVRAGKAGESVPAAQHVPGGEAPPGGAWARESGGPFGWARPLVGFWGGAPRGV